MARLQTTYTVTSLNILLLLLLVVLGSISPSAALAGWIHDGRDVAPVPLPSVRPQQQQQRPQRQQKTSRTIPRRGVTSSSAVPEQAQLDKILPPLPDHFQARIYLVRHAETDWNAQGRVQGCGFDIGLNDVGRSQAHATAQKLQGLPIGVIASSPLQRAATTADILHDMAHPTATRLTLSGFGEMNFGKYLEGISYKQRPTRKREIWQLFQAAVHVTARTPKFLWSSSGSPQTNVIHATFPGGGESMANVAQRSRQSLQFLLENHPKEKHIAIVSHKQTNKILLASLLWNNVLECEHIKQQNTCINVIDLDRHGNWHPRLLNYL